MNNKVPDKEIKKDIKINRENHIIFSTQGMGDLIINLPVILKIAEQEIVNLTLVVSNNGASQILKNLITKNKINIIEWNEKHSAIHNIYYIYKTLYNKKFDCAYSLYPSGKRENTLLRLTNSIQKNIFLVPGGYFKLFQFLNSKHKFTNNYEKHCLEINSEMLGISFKSRPRLIKNFDARNYYNIGFHIGAGNNDRAWSLNNFIKLINKLSTSYNLNIVIYAGKNEEETSRKLVKKINCKARLSINLGFEELFKDIPKLDLYIGNDSGFSHLCSFLGVKTIIIWAYANFYKTSPYNRNNLIIKYNDLCHKDYNLTREKNKVCKCINLIKPEYVKLIFDKFIHDEKYESLKFLEKIEILNSKSKILFVR